MNKRIAHLRLTQCDQARGTAVVIDVLRAFTTAAYAFGSGAREILLAGTPGEAFALREQHPDLLLMGEVDGLPIPGFDFGNSPVQLSAAPLAGRRLAQRTSAGVQGILRCINARAIVAASFVCARATARYVQGLPHDDVAFIITGSQNPGRGDEDAACAEYLAELLAEGQPDPAPYLERVRRSTAGRIFADPARPEFPAADLEYALRLDAFDFAMPVQRRDGALVMRAES